MTDLLYSRFDNSSWFHDNRIPVGFVQVQLRRGIKYFYDPGFVQGSGIFVSRNPRGTIFLLTTFDVGRLELIPHFARHYINSGICKENILVLAHSKLGNESDYHKIEHEFSKFGVMNILRWKGAFHASGKALHHLHMLQVAELNDWIVYTDADEFHDVDDWNMISQRLLKSGKNCLCGKFIDRFGINGTTAKVETNVAPSVSFPLKCQFTAQYFRTKKIVLAQASLRTNNGHHWIANRRPFILSNFTHLIPKSFPKTNPAAQIVDVDHFKWIDGILPQLETRYLNFVRLKNNNAPKLRKLIDALRAPNSWVVELCR